MTLNWRGVILDDRSAAMMNGAQALVPGIRIVPIQGSYSTSVGASAGTHAGGGAIDIGCRGLSLAEMRQIETAMRMVGWAAWLRFPNDLWDYHVHGVAVGCPDLASLARVQVQNYFDGLSGLAGGGPDTGDRSYVGVTWESFLAGGGSPGPMPAPGDTSIPGASWITGAGTFLTAVPTTLVGDTELVESHFSPSRLVAA